MTPTLQDVAMLLGLPISGDAVGPRVVPSTWLDDLEERFANIDIAIDVEEHPKATGPAKSCILQFQVHTLLCFLLVQLWFYFIIDLVLINFHHFYAARQFGT